MTSMGIGVIFGYEGPHVLPTQHKSTNLNIFMDKVLDKETIGQIGLLYLQYSPIEKSFQLKLVLN